MLYTKAMNKGDTRRINGDNWMVVDVAPAPELAEMAAVILQDDGYPTLTRGADIFDDGLKALGAQYRGLTYVLVPEAQGEAALALLAEAIEDFEGEDLEQFMREQGALPSEDADCS